MAVVHQGLTILTIGAIGAIIYTLATHPDVIDAASRGLDNLYKTGIAGSLGRVA
jgi:hypothetical protein